jgi:hypothetical protein
LSAFFSFADFKAGFFEPFFASCDLAIMNSFAHATCAGRLLERSCRG